MTIALALPAAWHERVVEVVLIGAGGTGSHLAGALMSLDHAVRSLGHPGGVHVSVYDSDRVTPSTTSAGKRSGRPTSARTRR